MKFINLALMQEPLNWPLLGAMAWVGMIAMSQLFAPRMRERETTAGGSAGLRDMEQ